MDKMAFCENFVHLDRKLICFDGRPYLPDIYAVSDRNLVLRCSRQTEKSTFLTNSILYEACTRPGIKILFVSPRMEQARVFLQTRLLTSLEQSPLVRRTLFGAGKKKTALGNMQFENGSVLYTRAAYHSADSARGISADLLLIDEFQDVAAGDLPVLQETLSHADFGRTILTGTPKLISNHLEAVFSLSTAMEWHTPCPNCDRSVIFDERCLGLHGSQCPDCENSLNPQVGEWVARNPSATWGEGYWINHLMVPWLNYDEILDRHRTYDLARFKNEVLGLSSIIGEHIVTRAELEACCSDTPMAKSIADIPSTLIPRYKVIAGIDWGGGGTSRTVVVIGIMRDDYIFQVFRFVRFAPDEDPDRVLNAVSKECQKFKVEWIAADGGGNGHVLNRLLLDRLKTPTCLYAILYSNSGQEPRQDGILWKWMVDRSDAIGALFARIKNGQMLFPSAKEVGSFLDEFECETAEYDDANRTVKFTHPETLQDDALHATNYALLVGIRLHYAAKSGGYY